MSNVERIIPNGSAAGAAIRAYADSYSGAPVERVEADLRQIIRSHDISPSEAVVDIAQRIVDGHRGEDIYD